MIILLLFFSFRFFQTISRQLCVVIQKPMLEAYRREGKASAPLQCKGGRDGDMTVRELLSPLILLHHMSKYLSKP